MKRKPQLTKREKKALAPVRAPSDANQKHIHCIACGMHLDPTQFDVPASAKLVRCAHGSTFASCVACEAASRTLLAEHDRTGQAVKSAAAWH